MSTRLGLSGVRLAVLAAALFVYLALVWGWRYGSLAQVEGESLYFFLKVASGPTSIAAYFGQGRHGDEAYWTRQFVLASVLLAVSAVSVACVRNLEARFAALGVGILVWFYYGLWLALLFL